MFKNGDINFNKAVMDLKDIVVMAKDALHDCFGISIERDLLDFSITGTYADSFFRTLLVEALNPLKGTVCSSELEEIGEDGYDIY